MSMLTDKIGRMISGALAESQEQRYLKVLGGKEALTFILSS